MADPAGLADVGGVSGGTVVAVAVLGAAATVVASALGVFGHWLADRRMGRRDLARSRQDAYAQYLSVQQRWVESERQVLFLLEQRAILKSKENRGTFTVPGDEAIANHISRELIEQKQTMQRVREDAAVSIYRVLLLAGPDLRSAIVGEPEGDVPGGAEDEEPTPASLQALISAKESHIVAVESAMRSELNP